MSNLDQNMTHYWNPGDVVVLRWITNGRLRIAQPNIVVKDSAEETALLLLPGTTCVVPEWLWRGDQRDDSRNRWAEESNGAYALREHTWHTNRLLMILEPDKFYSVIYFWHHDTNAFSCYYINFQIPFRRSHCGFDTYDLELDIVVEPSLKWEWKDVDGYHDGIEQGSIHGQWVDEIERAKPEIFTKLQNRSYPFDGHWINYQPSAEWAIPKLPEGWDKVE